ncbi:Pyridoxal phosphate-dependent transferase major region subdomain 1 [Penicillium macrosclerotiorum]|uniref:Pyridoxal phosphate-dependent transferase major region subdomain 1 n=1 Tax=Penicillium macrosclerotiorum TaxID=303699 RepID=UPI0025489C7B|nr:Pyridoxal phosphate-dependent transferase major region subdomain 1 [Penicillium macrosclerotiorum]KAJ5679940.1 Pyridoxal phosphate-dependent transferase major region subdomain 1 [Penicillium macrosclerotiorum]
MDERTSFGHAMGRHFSFEPGYRNLNHGSFGAAPTDILQKANELRQECERMPCPFIKYRFPQLLDQSRTAMSSFLGVPANTVVFVPNATTGINTVLRNLVWNADGRDEIIQLDVIYGACGKTTHYICEASQGRVRTREIHLTYPLPADDIAAALQEAIAASRGEGFRPRLAIFDTISSNPGLRLPFEALTGICRSEGVLSLIDAAHGVGQIDLHLSSLDPDFLVSNCHKWLFTPRGCAVFYVPRRNQALMRSTLPTSHGFVAQDSHDEAKRKKDVGAIPVDKSDFVSNFEFVGTSDNLAFLTVSEAIQWRERVCGGEKKIREYCIGLSRLGGQRVAQVLGTRVMDNEAQSLTNCCMVNVLLPLNRPTTGARSWVRGRSTDAVAVNEWMQQIMIEEYRTFMPVFAFQDQWWVRLSGQIYLDPSDFEWAAWTLKTLCERVELAASP